MATLQNLATPSGFGLAVVRPEIHPTTVCPSCPPLHLSSGEDHAEHTETSETHNSQHVPPLAALSPQLPMLHRPSPTTPVASQASRDLYLAALQHISSISVPPSQQRTAAPDELGLSDLKSRKDHHGMFSHHAMAFSIQPSPARRPIG